MTNLNSPSRGSADARESADDTSYKHRSCLACGKRIPRWNKGRQTPSNKRFCSGACGDFYRRMHPSASRGNCVQKQPVPQSLLKPVSATEDPPGSAPSNGTPEYAFCEACGRSCRIEPGKPTFCNERCRSYVPLPSRKPDGQWFTVAGPVNVCVACGLAITPTKPPWHKDGKLFCSADCRRARGIRFFGGAQ